MGVSRATLHRLEQGDAGVSVNTLAMALNALGRLDMLGDLAEQSGDKVGLMASRLQAPRRIARATGSKREERGSGGGPLVTEDGVEGW